MSSPDCRGTTLHATLAVRPHPFARRSTNHGGPDARLTASSGAGDLAEAVRTAVINKRAGGMGLISGRKAFQRPMAEGVELLHAIQDVYLNRDVTIA
jgi:DhnA family fructose-bisphosphate aldolase class Ia